jgi:hypothetical protein
VTIPGIAAIPSVVAMPAEDNEGDSQGQHDAQCDPQQHRTTGGPGGGMGCCGRGRGGGEWRCPRSRRRGQGRTAAVVGPYAQQPQRRSGDEDHDQRQRKPQMRMTTLDHTTIIAQVCLPRQFGSPRRRRGFRPTIHAPIVKLSLHQLSNSPYRQAARFVLKSRVAIHRMQTCAENH